MTGTYYAQFTNDAGKGFTQELTSDQVAQMENGDCSIITTVSNGSTLSHKMVLQN